MIIASADFWIDRAGLRSRVAKTNKRYGVRAGAYIRKVAQNSIRTRKKRLTRAERTARIGSPPISNSGFFKRSILFAEDTVTARTLIGPTGGKNNPSPAAFEHGGRCAFTAVSRDGSRKQMMGTFRRFPTMQPALIASAPKLSQFWAESFT